MTPEGRNPYSAPATNALPIAARAAVPPSMAATLRTAATVIAVDAARSLSWRTLVAYQMAAPESPLAKTGSLKLAVIVRLVFAIVMVRIVFSLTQHRTARVVVIVSASLYVLRLVIAALGGEELASQLAVVTSSVDDLVVILVGVLFGSACADAGMAAAARRVRALVTAYGCASVAGTFASANVMWSLRALPPGSSRVVVGASSITFVVVGIVAYTLVSRLRAAISGGRVDAR